ncbi:MAG: hypothetical protein WD317_09850 [Balneolaceae bacterium]
MSSTGDCLGICFADHQLFYAVNGQSGGARLQHIGCIDFNFPVLTAVSGSDSENSDSLKKSLCRLQDKYTCDSVRMLTPAVLECWSTFPRLVYETADEREDHLSIVMEGLPRSDMESTWHELSNQDYRLLTVRNRHLTENYRKLTLDFSQSDFVSEFELGSDWQYHTGMKGSYLTVNCQPDHLAVSSYLLGKLRGATFIRFESIDDLPYLWTCYARNLAWMNGIHEQIYVYGYCGLEIMEVLSSFLGETGQVILMNNLEAMNVKADESTYGFKLESSFPAIMLSLNLPGQKVTTAE